MVSVIVYPCILCTALSMDPLPSCRTSDSVCELHRRFSCSFKSSSALLHPIAMSHVDCGDNGQVARRQCMLSCSRCPVL